MSETTPRKRGRPKLEFIIENECRGAWLEKITTERSSYRDQLTGKMIKGPKSVRHTTYSYSPDPDKAIRYQDRQEAISVAGARRCRVWTVSGSGRPGKQVWP